MVLVRRIALNIVATYGRTVFAFLCGLFTARWALLALGKVDYGLYGVVGGLSFFITFFNSVLSGSVSRFYAVALGKGGENDGVGTMECRKWFNTALAIYTVVPLVAAAVCVPAGLWAVLNWLEIPPDRVGACVMVFFLVTTTAVAAMFCTPFQAMFIAKQRIAELTIYSFVQTVVNVIVMYYMMTHPREWLSDYAIYRCLLNVVPMAIIVLRAVAVFPECRIRLRSIWNRERVRQILGYAAWQVFGAGGALARTQLMQILVNRRFGPAANASVTVSNTVNGYACVFTADLVSVFAPAVYTACGAGDHSLMRRLADRVSRFGLAISLMVMLPLSLEMPEIMRLWLKTPPDHSAALCLLIMASSLAGQAVAGHEIVSNALGRISHYQMVSGLGLMTALPLAWLLMRLGCSFPTAVGGALLVSMLVSVAGRLAVARREVGMGVRKWLCSAVLPVASAALPAAAAGLLPRLWMAASFGRVCATTALVECVFLPLAWFVILDRADRHRAWHFLARANRT